MAADNFWNDAKAAQVAIQELKELKAVWEPWKQADKDFSDLKELSALVDPADAQTRAEVDQDLARLAKQVQALEFQTLLSDETDKKNAILSINAGAGGTESCDWAAMLFRMYLRWAEEHGYPRTVLDYLGGEEAGLKNVTLLIKGAYAYGYLKTESGVHRLVRISPFDSNKRRHTSFASVDVIAEIDDDIQVDLQEKDLRIDVYRASGPGGQGVNTTDSAVRITHLPTGLVVQCQNERSQHKNRLTAMKILKARLYERERQAREQAAAKSHAEKQKIEWGSQIRSYVMHPYNMVKDHRTDVERGKVDHVMDGGIDLFIETYLKQSKAGFEGRRK